MHSRTTWTRSLVLTGLCVAALCTDKAFGEAQSSGKLTILDSSGFWRAHITLRKPVVRVGKELKTTRLSYDTAWPDPQWAKPEFADHTWVRLCNPPFPPTRASYQLRNVRKKNAGWINVDRSATSLALICLRGKFRVNALARVKNMRLNARYRGGIVVYCNGREIARGHLPKDGDMHAPATDYPDEAFLNPKGKLLTGSEKTLKDKELMRRWDLRTRTLKDIVIPTDALRQGINVLGVEIHRAPYHANFLKEATKLRGWTRQKTHLMWSTCGLRNLRLTADSEAIDIEPNVARPKGLQVWTGNSMAEISDLDYSDPNEPLRPIRLVGSRNGSCSGRAVIGSTEAIDGLNAEVSVLKHADGKVEIPPSAILVRYAMPSGTVSSAAYPFPATRYDRLTSTPPKSIAIWTARKAARGSWSEPGQPAVVSGAVQPVWITVRIPNDATPGKYSGKLNIKATGQETVSIPIELAVTPFRLPSPRDYRTSVDFIQSPESVALKYKVPLWSDEHFRKMEKSFEILGYLSNKTLYLHLICFTNQGNAETLVRWIDKGNGQYEHDFKAFDRYVDLAVKHMGKPKIICLYGWDWHIKPDAKDPAAVKVPVTRVDPSSKKVSTLKLPHFCSAEGAPIWKQFIESVMSRLKARGLDQSAMLGLAQDSPPPSSVIEFYGKALPGVPWMRHAHTTKKIPGARVGYQALVWSPKFVQTPSRKTLQGWNNKVLDVHFRRDKSMPSRLNMRLYPETNIQGKQRGVGRFGLDGWSVLEAKGRGGKKTRTSIHARYPASGWRNLDWMLRYLAYPGPDGAQSSVRIEMMREGLQECEARIVVERAIVDKERLMKLDRDLAARCRTFIADRTQDIAVTMDSHYIDGFDNTKHSEVGSGVAGPYWFLCSDWQSRSERLYRLAAEVQQNLKE